MIACVLVFFFFSSRRRHAICYRDWSSDVCSSDLPPRGSCGFPRLGSRRGLSSSGPHLIFTKICMPPWKCLPSLGPNVVDGFGNFGLKEGALHWRQASVPARLLPGLRGPPRQGSCPGVAHLALLLFVFLVLPLLWLSCAVASPLASLLCPAKCGRGAWL